MNILRVGLFGALFFVGLVNAVDNTDLNKEAEENKWSSYEVVGPCAGLNCGGLDRDPYRPVVFDIGDSKISKETLEKLKSKTVDSGD